MPQTRFMSYDSRKMDIMSNILPQIPTDIADMILQYHVPTPTDLLNNTLQKLGEYIHATKTCTSLGEYNHCIRLYRPNIQEAVRYLMSTTWRTDFEIEFCRPKAIPIKAGEEILIFGNVILFVQPKKYQFWIKHV